MKPRFSIHTINYEGFSFSVFMGSEYKCDSPRVCATINNPTRRGMHGGKMTLRQRLDYLIVEEKKAVARKEWHTYVNQLTVAEKIGHADFVYARFQASCLGNYYNLYWKSSDSPTGVELVGGCDVPTWEALSKQVGKSTQYLSPTEGKQTAH